ncbi:hypothetical protein [Bosea sp. BIWAKO-01]|uniref:hypothetical protein n=1 Tax=Bosea sp. BIWAKO-01 TaxID=506668 RepID=UPI00085323D1|nr:hypothetical protein [Bosea sp. BIWAKO-01]GAU85989.1 hypothetical protein BIWAKO_05937 [Bosea sp. BIWAKO-01]
MLRHGVIIVSLALAGCQAAREASPGPQRPALRPGGGNATLEALANRDAAACIRESNTASLSAKPLGGAGGTDQATARRSDAAKAVYDGCMARRGHATPPA